MKLSFAFLLCSCFAGMHLPLGASEPTERPTTDLPSRAREVWIAPDHAQPEGKGTRDDPYDGSTAGKFDTLLTNLPKEIEIHLLSGTFETSGWLGFNIKEGWNIRGAGMALTTVRLVPGPEHPKIPQYVVFNNDRQGVLHHAELHDLTIDGNIANQPDGYQVQGGGIGAASGVLENIRLIHWGATPADFGEEQWGLGFAGGDDGSGVANGTIRGCVVDPPVSGIAGASMLCFGSLPAAPSLRVSGVIENNVSNGARYNEYGIALAGSVDGVRIVNNRVRHAARGMHHDTAADQPTRHVLVANNYFEDCRTGIGVGGKGSFVGYIIRGNTVTLSTAPDAIPCATEPVGVQLYGVPSGIAAGSAEGCVVEDNLISRSTETPALPPAADPRGGFHFSGAVSHVTLRDNLLEPGLRPGTIEPMSLLAACAGNRYTDGSILPGLPDKVGDIDAFGTISALAVKVDGSPVPRWVAVPASSTAPGDPGDQSADADFLYLYIDADHGWKRLPLQGF